jgi:predicted ATPase/class 3 adenylate cyclase
MHRLVPQFILENYQAENFHGNFQAVCLLADVSGFSTMTDVLAQHGLHGSEVLANGMRKVFDPMIQSVMEYGGHVVGFAGDAITALFPVTESIEAAYTRAITAARDIQTYRTRNANFITPYGQFNISVKIGLGAGEARWRIVVAADGKRATYYFHGSSIDAAVNSLNLAKSGQIVLCPVAVTTMGSIISGQQEGEYFLLEGFSGSIPEPVIINIPAPNSDHLRVFCSDEVSTHQLTGEFRPAVNLFIGIQLDSEREIYLEAFLQRLFTLQDLYGGLFSRVDVGDKGTNLLMFWGAPLARENDVERALGFMLELLKGTSFPMKAGITYRLAYAGYMGGSLQEEYTCYGWGVNLSARLMVATGAGEIWTDEEIARRAGRRFTFQHAGQQKLKGFAQEQSVFRLLKRKEDDRAVFSGEFIGRAAELETLSRFISPIWSGRFAGMLTMTGEPGIGKSRLVDAFQLSKLFTERSAHWAVCQTDEIVRQSLNPFRYWLKRYFNISESMDETQSKQAFDTKLDEIIASIPDPGLSQTLNRTRSFLGELVDLHWEDSLYEKLDARGRYDSTFIALSTLLRGESLKQPVIILIEDAHLLDNDTKAFLPYLERTLTAELDKSYPLAILATARPEGIGVTLEYSPSEEISLSVLGHSDLLQLAEDLLGGTTAPSLLRILEQRTEGNPFFVEQIIRFLQEEGKLEESRLGWQIAAEQTLESLPTDISSILVSRLDRLNREVKEVVQTASILGREFELRLLSQMLYDDKSLPEKVQYAVDADILSLLTEIRYIFRHALVRDAAYNMQLRARQRELHQIAVNAFEILYQDQLSPHYVEIAYHADRAGLSDKAKKFYVLAGADAAQAYKNSLAIESYTRALALSSIKDIQERIELLLARVALYRIVADHDGQEQDLATLELLAEKQKNNRNRAIVALRQADFAFDSGEFQEAQRLAESAIKFAESVNALDVVANAYRNLPLALARQGHILQAIQAAQTGLPLTQQMGDLESEGQTLNQLGLIMIEQNEIKQAKAYFDRSLTLARASGNRRLEAQVLNNMGVISGLIENDYSNARILYEKTLEIAREIGNRTGEGQAVGNLGWAASMIGDFEKAHNYYLKRLTISRETGNRSQETYAMINLGAMKISQEIYSDALEYEEHALNLAHKIGDPSAEAWASTFLGYAYLGLGNYREATHTFQTALDIRYSLGQQTLAMEPLAGLAQVEMDQDQLSAALDYIENIISYLKEGGSLEGTEEPLRIYLTIYLAFLKNHDSRAKGVLEDAYALLKEQAQKIQEKTPREMFIQNVPWRRQIAELWQRNQGKKQ